MKLSELKAEYADIAAQAKEMMKYSYAPYSNFRVGAALLSKNGSVYTGCNVENASYSATICAERNAIFKAVSEGVKEFKAICIVGGKDGIIEDYCPPCGTCRQVMAEFCEPDTFEVVLVNSEDDVKVIKLADLLPHSFNLVD